MRSFQDIARQWRVAAPNAFRELQVKLQLDSRNPIHSWRKNCVGRKIRNTRAETVPCLSTEENLRQDAAVQKGI